MDEDDDYDFEYEDPDEDDAADDDATVEMENQYYNSKGQRETAPEEAVKGFREVVESEKKQGAPGEWGFKALKQIVKLLFALGRYPEMMAAYREMLSYVRSAVTRSKSEKTLNSILETISASEQAEVLKEFYEATLEALKHDANERLWFKTNLKLGKLWFDRKEYAKLTRVLKDLRKSCQLPTGEDDPKKGTQLLEVLALEIQMWTEQKNQKKLKELYTRALAIKGGVPHPKILGIIRESGGKLWMLERHWDNAYEDFYRSFCHYDESGVGRRIQCLKYMLLANMLRQSDVNPFDAQEVRAMASLIGAYQRNDISAFEKLLKEHNQSIMGDAFVAQYINDLLRNIRTQVLVRLIRPYSRLRIPFIAQELHIPEADVESLLIALILDGKIRGKIDQVNAQLEVYSANVDSKYHALEKWAQNLASMNNTLAARVA